MTSGKWANSDRRSRLPADWESRRSRVRARSGGRCEIIGSDNRRCRRPARECDHIIRGDDHRIENLQDICLHHHRKKSAAEGVAARAARPSAKRPAERHPGERTPR